MPPKPETRGIRAPQAAQALMEGKAVRRAVMLATDPVRTEWGSEIDDTQAPTVVPPGPTCLNAPRPSLAPNSRQSKCGSCGF
jgi:hypothetical protein